MQLFWGTYGFPINQLDITSSFEVQWNEGGQAYSVMKRFAVTGELLTAGQADTTAQQTALIAALQVQNVDLKLLQDSAAVSADVLLVAGSITGTRCTKFAFPKGREAQYATFRSFSAEFEAEYPLPASTSLLLSWTERVTYSGGAPLYKILPNINGPGQKQLVYPLMPFEATQQGEIVGYRSYPSASLARPLWPGQMLSPPEYTRDMPRRRGPRGQTMQQAFRLGYSYKFGDPDGLTAALPNVWVQ